jgi:hypothetical protein
MTGSSRCIGPMLVGPVRNGSRTAGGHGRSSPDPFALSPAIGIGSGTGEQQPRVRVRRRRRSSRRCTSQIFPVHHARTVPMFLITAKSWNEQRRRPLLQPPGLRSAPERTRPGRHQLVKMTATDRDDALATLTRCIARPTSQRSTPIATGSCRRCRAPLRPGCHVPIATFQMSSGSRTSYSGRCVRGETLDRVLEDEHPGPYLPAAQRERCQLGPSNHTARRGKGRSRLLRSSTCARTRRRNQRLAGGCRAQRRDGMDLTMLLRGFDDQLEGA